MTPELLYELDCKRRRTKDQVEAMRHCLLIAQIKQVLDGNEAVMPYLVRQLSLMENPV